MAEREEANTAIVITYTIYPSDKERLKRELEYDLFELQYRNSYLKDAITKELQETPESLPIGKTLEIDINDLRIDELKQMIARMYPND